MRVRAGGAAKPMGPAPPQPSDREREGRWEVLPALPGDRFRRENVGTTRQGRARPGVQARAWPRRESQQHCVPHRPQGLLLVPDGRLPVLAWACSCHLRLGCAICSGPQTCAGAGGSERGRSGVPVPGPSSQTLGG